MHSLPDIPAPLRVADRAFRQAEGSTALIFRCRPTNHRSEQQRLIERWTRGDRCEPAWRYATRAQFAPLRGELDRLAEALSRHGELGVLYAARARELSAEAELAEHVNGPEFSRLARARFAPEVSSAAAAEALAASWISVVPDAPEWRVESDDRGHPLSLVRQLQRLIAATKLPYRVELSEELMSIAATGDRVFIVATGRSLSANDGLRIAVHEVFGHGLPWERARGQNIGLFAVASERGVDDQEGFAVLCEERAGALDVRRKFDLAARHLAASRMFAGASWVETCEGLLNAGVSVEHAVVTACRVYRGGGLGREIAYLPALCRVRTALVREPNLERWLTAGRVSVPAAQALSKLTVLTPSLAGAWGARTTCNLQADLARVT